MDGDKHRQNLSYHAYNGLAYRIYMVSFQHGSGTAVGDSRGGDLELVEGIMRGGGDVLGWCKYWGAIGWC